MRFADLLSPGGPFSDLRFFEKVKRVLERSRVPGELELRELDKASFEPIARFAVEELDEGERREFYERFMEILRKEGSGLPEELEVKIHAEKLSREKRLSFAEVVPMIRIEEAVKEANRCLRCKVPRCIEACPLKFPVPAYLKAVADGRVEDATKLGLRIIPTLGVCGRICVGYCEEACVLGQLSGEAVKIRYVKRAVADSVKPEKLLPKARAKSGFKVAVIGSGPAGLTAAYHLSLLGHEVTVFEAGEAPGGMLRTAIPEYRLPSRVVKEELEVVERVGVKFVTGVRLGRDLTLDDLFKRGYSAVFIATGAGETRIPAIKGAELEGVRRALDFLIDVKKGLVKRLEGRVWVIGG
ncbi:MAG: FAD-dependent oxidoreductase, partial [Thaumarchaeota archaeon]|nr:FAD-dependent oxidoreductase [Nitrososphaerota archaeon]